MICNRKPTRRLPKIIAVLVFCSATSRGVAQPSRSPEVGHPYIRNFGPKDFGAPESTWATIQDRRGLVYVGNQAGILEYDGVSWRVISTPVQSYVRSFAMDANGRIYVGASGDLGYLAPDEKGKMRFVSLLGQLPPEDRNFNDVWKTICTSDGVYFQAHERLFRWSSGVFTVWKPKVRYVFASYVRDRLYVGDASVGLLRMEYNSLVAVAGFSRFADSRRLILF